MDVIAELELQLARESCVCPSYIRYPKYMSTSFAVVLQTREVQNYRTIVDSVSYIK